MDNAKSYCVTSSEEAISKSFCFNFCFQYVLPIFEWYFDYTIKNIENVPKSGSVLFVYHHTIHNHELLPACFLMHKKTGKVVRGLSHRIVITLLPILKSFGLVRGYRDTAIQLLKDGQWLTVIPGGGEEAMCGFENAYKLNWVSNSGRRRSGFVKVAIESDAVIIPVAGHNVQEMFFNIFGFIMNYLYISKLYNYLLCLPGGFGWFFTQLKMYCWFITWTFFSIPVPVRAWATIGKPLKVKKGESNDEFALRVQETLQNMIDVENPGGLNYTRAIKERFNQASSKKKS